MTDPTLHLSSPLRQTDSTSSRLSRTSSQVRKRTSVILHKAIHTLKRSDTNQHKRSMSVGHPSDLHQQEAPAPTPIYTNGNGSLKAPPSRTKSRESSRSQPQRAQSKPALQANGTFPYTGVIQRPDRSVKAVPAAPLNLEQQRKYDQVLAYFQKQAGGENSPGLPTSLKDASTLKPLTDFEKLRLLSRESILRYLRATRWDVQQAQRRLTETVAWRREFGVDDTTADDVEEEAKCGKESVLGFDYKARPLHLMFPHRNNTPESPRQMKFAVWILERCIDLMPAGVEQLALLIDFDSKSRNPTSIANAKLMLYILQNHYVERLGIALCINVPWIFKAFWTAIQPFIDPVTKAKCKFDEAVTKEVPSHHLTTEFGGKLDFPYDHDAYWADLVQTCEKRQAEMLERFRTLCGSKLGASEYVILGGDPDHAPGGRDVPGVYAQADGEKKVAATKEGETAALEVPKSEPTTAQSSEGPRTPDEGLGASPAPQLVAPKARVNALHLNLPSFGGSDEPETEAEKAGADFVPPATPMERYRTPVSVLDVEHPLERTFSNATQASAIQRANTPGNAVVGATAPAHATVDEEREAEEAELTPRGRERVLAERTNGHAATTDETWDEKLRKRLHIGEGTAKETTKKDSRKDKLDSFFERHKRAASILGPALGHHAHGERSASTSSSAGAESAPVSASASPTRSTKGLPFVSRGSHSRRNSESGRRGSGIFASLGRKQTNGSSKAPSETTATRSPKLLPVNGEAATVASPEQLGAEEDAQAFPGLHGASGAAIASASPTIKVLLFASARTAMGGPSELSITLPHSPLALSDLSNVLLAHAKDVQGADLEALKAVLSPKGGARWSVGQEMVEEGTEGTTKLKGGEEVAIIPPVSGG